ERVTVSPVSERMLRAPDDLVTKRVGFSSAPALECLAQELRLDVLAIGERHRADLLEDIVGRRRLVHHAHHNVPFALRSLRGGGRCVSGPASSFAPELF